MARGYRRGCSGAICTGKLTCHICNSPLLGSSVYVFFIGFVGTLITAFDLLRKLGCKDKDKDKNNETPDEANDDNTPPATVPDDLERDLKLMISVLGIEHYTLIMLGVLTDYPMLLAPWLLMQLGIIIIETMVFFIRVFLDGLHINRDEILLTFLTFYNWLQVFCVYQVLLSQVCF